MRLLHRFVAAPVAAIALIYVLLASGSGAAAIPIPGRCTAAAFRPFAEAVWSVRWQRGAPAPATLRAERRRIACAPPAHAVAMRRFWNRKRAHYNERRDHCLSGPVFAGRVSTFGPPAEGAGITATGASSAAPGIALYNQSTLGAMFRVSIAGRATYLRQTDIGPAPWTGRVIDFTGAAAAKIGGVTTDALGSAKLIPGDCI